MNNFCNEDELITTSNGIRYLNKEASRRFYELYKDVIDEKYSDTLFRYDLALKAYQSLPREIKKELSDIDKLKIEYNKLTNDNIINKKDFFSLLYSCSKIIKKRVSLNDLKEYAKELNNDLYSNNINEFDLYITLCQKGFIFVLNNCCETLEDLLYIFNLEVELDINSDDISNEIIDEWINKNNFYSKDNINDFNRFISNIKISNNCYSNELFLYLNKKYDLISISKYSISIEEEIKIKDNFESNVDYIFKIPSILNREIEYDELINYALYIKDKYKIDYDENSLKLYIRIKDINKPVILTNLLGYVDNLYDLLTLLQLPIIYKFEVENIDLSLLDNWLNKHNYYSLKNKKVLETKFLNSLKTCPKDYFDSTKIVEHIESNTKCSDIKLDSDEYIILKKYRPVTDMKKKKLIGSLFFSTGIIASLYLTIIKNENPSRVILNCTKTFSKYSMVNNDLKNIIENINSLDIYFKDILTTNLGGYFVKKYYEEEIVK